MSIYYAAQWSVRQPDVTRCEQALPLIAEHIKKSHPGVRSVQVYRQSWGPFPRRAYLWLEEYESLTTMDAEQTTPECAEVWQPIHDLAQAGTFVGSIWSDLDRKAWFNR